MDSGAGGLMIRQWLPEKHVLTTKLPPTECQARVQARLAKWPNWRPSADHPVAGSVSPTGFSLTKVISSRNSFQTVATGTFRALEQDTRIGVSLGPSPFVLAFGLVWLLITGSFLLVGLSSGAADSGNSGPTLIPLAMFVGGLALAVLGRFLARDEAQFLLRFLETELEAHELPIGDLSCSTRAGGRCAAKG